MFWRKVIYLMLLLHFHNIESTNCRLTPAHDGKCRVGAIDFGC